MLFGSKILFNIFMMSYIPFFSSTGMSSRVHPAESRRGQAVMLPP